MIDIRRLRHEHRKWRLLADQRALEGASAPTGGPTSYIDYLGPQGEGFRLFAYEDVVRMVVPELQRRELFRTEYTGATLRENLGLERPAVAHG